MKQTRVRRPLLFPLALMLMMTWGCNLPQSGTSSSASDSSTSSEAERTRKMEEKAARSSATPRRSATCRAPSRRRSTP